MTEAQVYRISDPANGAEWNRLLAQISNRLDEMQGLRGTTKFYGDVDMQSNTIVNAGISGSAAMLDAYPIGALYLSVVSTDPGALFGGTWVAFGTGRMLVGYNAADADFDTAEETGGGKTKDIGDTVYWGVQGGETDESSFLTTPMPLISDYPEDVCTGSIVTRGIGESAQDVMNPYIVVYMWKRTA